jgi:GMP synthase (glutamine-hydrolysing)
MRKNESENVVEIFGKELDANLIYVDATDRFLDLLAGVSEPEKKRKIIGAEFINVFADEARKLEGVEYLAQGTIYPDILESFKQAEGKKAVKSHHNVGGLPEDLNFQLVEPVKFLYKDEVRVVGKQLGLPDNMVYRQPFPGPGLGVRCVGAITRDRLEALREADAIVREEIGKMDPAPWQYFCAIPDFQSTGIKDGKRYMGWAVVIRAINTVDAVTAEAVELPWEMLKAMRDRIIATVPGVNRVLWDLSDKPVATIEWE